MDQFELIVIDFPGNVDADLHKLVPFGRVGALETGNAITFHPYLRTALRPGRNLDPFERTVDRRDLDAAPKNGLCEGDRFFDKDIVSIPGKNRMRENGDIQIKITGRAALNSGVPLAGKSQFLPCADPRWNFHADFMNLMILLKGKLLLYAGYRLL